MGKSDGSRLTGRYSLPWRDLFRGAADLSGKSRLTPRGKWLGSEAAHDGCDRKIAAKL